MRSALLRLHRYVGLALAAFLIVIGATGSIIVWQHELDRWLNSDTQVVMPQGERMDLLDLREKLEAEDPKSHVYYVHFLRRPEEGFHAYAEGAIDPVTGQPLPIAYDEVWANPYTGERLSQRHWGDFPLERKNLITFVYFLHYSLVLPEALGEPFMGLVALFFALDCFVGFYLTLPRRKRGAVLGSAERAPRLSWARGFLSRWKPSWQVNTRLGANRLTFDWHRASGLWIWPMLLIFAISGFALNLPGAYSAALGRLVPYVDNDDVPKLERPLVRPAIGWREAHALGQKYMDEAARTRGFTVDYPTGLVYRREKGFYDYRVHSSRDLIKWGATSVTIDATTGALRGVEVPTGDVAGTTFTNWINALHQATVFGTLYRIFVSCMGILLVALAVTGVLIWWRKAMVRGRTRLYATIWQGVLAANSRLRRRGADVR